MKLGPRTARSRSNHSPMNAPIPRPKTNPPWLCSKPPCPSLSARRLNAPASHMSSPRPSFSTTDTFHLTFRPKSNDYNYLYIIVLSKACRIITIQKPCENKIAPSSQLNRSESTICRSAHANLRFEKYYQRPPLERETVLGRAGCNAATPANLTLASVESGLTNGRAAQRSPSPV
jgi:hypothetical protein